jgi:hypothetical protein
MSALLTHLENIENGLTLQLEEVRKAKEQLMAKERVSTRSASRKTTQSVLTKKAKLLKK